MNSDTSQIERSDGLYHFIWRWHFIAGLFVAPFVVILAVTGALYLFKDEIERAVYAPLMQVAPVVAGATPSAQESAVLRMFPGAKITRYVAPAAADRTAEFALRTPDGQSLTVFVDPGAARVTGAIANESRVSNVLSGLHGELLSGRTGDLLVEFAGCWAFVLLVTGLFLWWPRKDRRAGVLAPRLKARGRAFWRDLHAVPAAWNAPFVGFLILSGLPWSGFWGETLARLGTLEATAAIMAPTPNFTAAPGAPPHAQHEHHHHVPQNVDDNPAAADLPWAIRQAPAPAGGETHGVSLDELVALAQARDMTGSVFRVIYPSGPGGVFTLSHVPATAEGQRTVHVDPADGAIVQDVAWRQYSPLGKAVEFGVQTHVGRQFGAANRWLMLGVCMTLVATVAFGVVSWWRRRPSGRLGVPPVPEGYRPAWPIAALALALGVAFPLVGASMLLVIAAAWLLRRLPAGAVPGA